MAFQTVFKRYELKYLLTRAQKERILEAMEPYMALDKYGRTTIRNIYFDTDNYRLIRRSIEKVLPGAPHEVWLTVDASLGSNVLSQAKHFSETVGVTGLILTKLDGTGKGGMAVALHQECSLPTFFVGLGEQPEDLQPFNPEFFAAALFEQEVTEA